MKLMEMREIMKPLVLDFMVNKKSMSYEFTFTGEEMGLPDSDEAKVILMKKEVNKEELKAMMIAVQGSWADQEGAG